MARAMSSSVRRVLLVAVLFAVVVQEGLGLPLSSPSESPARTVRPHGLRTKRCSCNSWLDKECIYFCHLDIIWVNTPSKIVPYGLGSHLSRRRRSADRCECAEGRTDAACSSFCHNSSEITHPVRVSPNKNNRKTSLLATLRSIVHLNTAIEQKSRPVTRRPSKGKH